ncbi:MAG TPA: hypothetical protein VF316_15010 [Polyangiaceae bacterium]
MGVTALEPGAAGTTPRPTYLLDNNIVSYFLNCDRKADLQRIATGLELAVVAEVHEEALRYAKRGAEYKKWQATSGVSVRRILLGTSASICLAHLRKNTGGLKDLGELASIALASEDERCVVVMNDKNGLWIALQELFGPTERVIRLSTFLRRAHAAVGLDARAARELAGRANLLDAPPSWWDAWLKSLPAG